VAQVKSKSPTIVTIRLTRATRWLLLLPALCAIFGSWFAVRWYVANTLAEYAPNVADGGLEMARMAVRWAPGDPFTHWRLASLEEKVFTADNLADAVREHQLAVTLSPNDYRYWMEFGRALEASGDIAGGEKALRRAVELAPAYSHPRWYFGNVLLREGKLDEAFVQLARAAEADVNMRPQVFNLAWQVFSGDVDQIARVACPSTPVRIQFAVYLVTRAKFDEAMQVWRTINPAERKAQATVNRDLKDSFIRAKQFRAALEVMRESEPEAGGPVPEQVWNGGFESEIESKGDKNFRWLINSKATVQAGIDTQAHSGHGSLRIDFKAPDQLDNIPVAQTIVVEPNTQYHFECYLRSEELIGSSTPMLSIVDAANDDEIVRSPPAATGTNDWQRITFDFQTPPKSDGVILKLVLARCGAGETCPIFGTIWYDDFQLQRSSSRGSPRGSATNRKR
jgi:tetratricopeptide (TPR) repeat protein